MPGLARAPQLRGRSGTPLCPLATALLAAAPGHSGEAAALPLGNAPRASTQLRAQGRARREQRRC